jgi:peptidoglycan/xylan/chitin deacetylase (PgdA/CDA1 family)
VTLADMLSKEAHAGHVSLTFDDGYSSFKSLGYRILMEQGIRATIYAVAGLIGKTNLWDSNIGDRSEPLMTADELRELCAAGYEISSHGMTHAHLTELSDAELRVEVADSKKLIEDLIGAPVAGFGYPYGQWDARIREAVMEAGYVYAASTRKGVIRPGQDMYDIPRINVRWNNVPSVLLRKLREADGLGC